MPSVWFQELKWALVASLLVHGAALAWLPVQAVAPPASLPPLEVRLFAQASSPRSPAPTEPVLRAMPAGAAASSQRTAPEIAEPTPEAVLLAAPAAATAVLRSVQGSVPLAAVNVAQAADASAEPTEAAPSSATVADIPVASDRLRQAGPAEATPAGPPHAAGPVPSAEAPAVVLAAAGQARALAPMLRSVGAAGAQAPPSRPVSETGDRGAMAAADAVGQQPSLAYQRDKTPWAAALPVAALAQPQALRTPESTMRAETASEPHAQTAAIAPAPSVLRAAAAGTLSLLEAEGAPSNAIAHARLSETSRACYAPPPTHWNAQGRVVLRVRVDAAGRPVEVMLESGSGEPRLDRLAIEQTRGCARFDISDRQGRPRAATVRLPVIYRFAD